MIHYLLAYYLVGGEIGSCSAFRKSLEITQYRTKWVPEAPVPGREIGQGVKLPTDLRYEVKAMCGIRHGDTSAVLLQTHGRGAFLTGIYCL